MGRGGPRRSPIWLVFVPGQRVAPDSASAVVTGVHHRNRSTTDDDQGVAAMVSGYRTICFVDGCGHVPAARGYCRGHYTQLYRHGRITGLLRSSATKADSTAPAAPGLSSVS